MVKKLYKHEFAYYLRSMLPIYGILLGIATLARVIQFFEADNTVYDILSGTSVGSYVICVITCLVLTTVFTITRYYRNLFTAEGYLTFTLPVTPAQHMWTKLLTATAFQLISLVIVFSSLCIISAGDLLNEIIKAGVYLFNRLPQDWQAHFGLFVGEGILLTVATTVNSLLLFYACITVGQMFNKNRVLAAVGIYVGYYIVTQILGTIVTVFAAFLPWGDIGQFFMRHTIGCIHGGAWATLLFTTLISAAYFILSHQIIRHKLNLE